MGFPIIINGKETKKLFMTKNINFDSESFVFEKLDDNNIKEFFIEAIIIKTLDKVEKKIRNKKDFFNDIKGYLNQKIGRMYTKYIEPKIYYILLLILVSIEGGDYIKFNHYTDFYKIWNNLGLYLSFKYSKGFKEKILNYKISDIFFEKDFGKDFDKLFQAEEIQLENLFNKKRVKKIIFSNGHNERKQKNSNSNYFSECSEKGIIGQKYYMSFLELLNNYSSDYPEDIEISIYNNLKKENQNRKKILKAIKELMNDFINDEESKKGFMALLRQSFLIGKLRNEIVRIYFIFYFIGK